MKCKTCKETIPFDRFHPKRKRKYCSVQCSVLARRKFGKENPLWKNAKLKLFCKVCNLIFYDYKSNKRKYCSQTCLYKSRIGRSNLHSIGKNNHLWKGNNVTYGALHHWVRRWKPKPKSCENCGEEKRLDVANISGKYKRDIDDYWYLCRSCHIKFDRGLFAI